MTIEEIQNVIAFNALNYRSKLAEIYNEDFATQIAMVAFIAGIECGASMLAQDDGATSASLMEHSARAVRQGIQKAADDAANGK